MLFSFYCEYLSACLCAYVCACVRGDCDLYVRMRGDCPHTISPPLLCFTLSFIFCFCFCLCVCVCVCVFFADACARCNFVAGYHSTRTVLVRVRVCVRARTNSFREINALVLARTNGFFFHYLFYLICFLYLSLLFLFSYRYLCACYECVRTAFFMCVCTCVRACVLSVS